MTGPAHGRTRLLAALLAGLLVGPLAAQGPGPGITLPPMKIGLDAAVSAEGEAPFQVVVRRVAQAVDHPVVLRTYRQGDELVRDLEQGRLSFAVISCPSLNSLSASFRTRSRVLAALVLGGERKYGGVLLRPRDPVPETRRGTVAVPSAESAVGRSRELLRRRLRPRIFRGSLDAMERALGGETEYAVISDLALKEARYQGFQMERFEIVDKFGEIPFEAFLAAPSVPLRHDSRIRTVLLSARSRSPGRVSVEWRVADAKGYGRECSR